MAIFALLAFTSQSFAIVKLPCGQMTDQSLAHAVAGTIGMDHTGHSHENNARFSKADKADSGGCCGQESCSQMDCISASAAVVGSQSAVSIQFFQTLNTEYLASFVNREASSLFRPPISR